MPREKVELFEKFELWCIKYRNIENSNIISWPGQINVTIFCEKTSGNTLRAY